LHQIFTQGCTPGRRINLARKITEAATIEGMNLIHSYSNKLISAR